MRHLFLVLVAVTISLVSVAQQYEVAKTSGGTGYDIETAIETSETIILDGKSFDVFKTTKGSKMIVQTSKAGKKYPTWLGEPTNDMFDGQTVYQFKSGSVCIFVTGKSGNIYAKWLNKTNG